MGAKTEKSTQNQNGAYATLTLQVIQSDDQLANRFEPLPLPRWREDDEFRTLLASFESVLPLRRPSTLTDPKIVRTIQGLSEGILGEVVTLLARASEAAIETGRERIDLEGLRSLAFISPSQRRASAVALGVA